jgi:hypothetical protein
LDWDLFRAAVAAEGFVCAYSFSAGVAVVHSFDESSFISLNQALGL